MSNLNKALLIGRLTNFSIATNRWSTGPDGERKEFTDYHNIVAYPIGKRNLAETVAQYTRKGALVYIEGRIQTRSWDKDGTKQYRTEIVVDTFQFGPQAGGTDGARPVNMRLGGCNRAN